MKIFNKTKLNVALTSALAGLVLVASQSAMAIPQAPAAAGDAYVSVNNLGQALLYPYYTVNNGMKTLINVVNTDATRAVAVKVRFRESENSRDVLDFNLVLSPSDKWSGYLELGTNGPVLKTADNSCTAPAIPTSGAPFSSDSYLGGGFKDAGSQTKARMNEGYAEIIAMGWANPTLVTNVGERAVNAAYNADHTTTGTPRSCTAVRNAFLPTNTVAPAGNAILPANADGAPTATTDFIALTTGENPLRGTLVIQNKAGGIAAGTTAVAIADYMDPVLETAGAITVAALDGTNLGGVGVAPGPNLITAQSYPFYLEPTLASRSGLWTLVGLPVVDAALSSSTIMNEWANNTANGAHTDWAVTFPTKSFHVDAPNATAAAGTGYTNGHYQSGVSIHRAGTTLPAGFVTQLPPFAGPFLAVGGSKVDLGASVGIYDNEEQTSATGLEFSPGTFSTPNLPWEANVITFSGTSVLSSANPLKITPPGTAQSGWMTISPAANNAGLAAAYAGLPTAGFAMKERNSGDATLSFGQMMGHSYK